jgi:hypothetical protein
MDAGIHGEQGWMLESLPAPAVELPGSAGGSRKAASVMEMDDR